MDFPPPPPPPPASVMLNHQAPLNLNANRNDRSQLLIDIERGTALKKVASAQKGLNSRPVNSISSSNDCNGIDNNNYNEDSVNPIKNQLQAELCSTLHRRQNGGTKKPNFIVPKNTTINAINNQLRELQNNAQTQPATNGKTTTEPSPVKQSATTDAKDKDEKPKLLLSHGKPNFKISSNSIGPKKFVEKDDSSASNELFGTLRRRLKSVESLDEIEPVGKAESLRAQNIVVQEPQKGVQNQQKSVQAPLKSVPQSVVVQEPQKSVQVPQKSTQTPQKSLPEQSNVTNGVNYKSPIAPPLFYKASVKNFTTVSNNVSSVESNSEIKRTIRRLKSVELLDQIEKSNDERTELNDIQRRIQNLKTVEINKVNSSSNGFTETVEINKVNSSSNGFTEIRTEEHNQIESISVKSVTETDCFQSSPILPRRAQLFKQQQNLANPKISSPTIHHINHGHLNYKVKPVTSFSRDLQLTPNRYPEKIPVMKTVEPEPVFFSDIKFAINSNGEVVRS